MSEMGKLRAPHEEDYLSSSRFVPGDRAFREVLSAALNWPWGQFDVGMEDFLGDNERRGHVIHEAFAAIANSHIMSAAAAIHAPGNAAMVIAKSDPPSRFHTSAWVSTTAELLQLVISSTQHARPAVYELLIPVDAGLLSEAAHKAGFRRITRLAYMSHPLPVRARRANLRSDLRVITRCDCGEEVFERALADSYAQSLDCPELTGLRRPREILASHRATGDYDPALWHVALQGNEPVGLLLLTRLSRQRAMELVYLGVAQLSRGAGVASTLLHSGLDRLGGVSANTLALAVDVRNTPARRFYDAWGFCVTGFREAWIATPAGTKV